MIQDEPSVVSPARSFAKISAMALLAVFLMSAGCRRAGDSPKGTEPARTAHTVTIGSILPLSGPNAHYGEDNKAGMEVGLAEVNRTGMVYVAPDGSEIAYTLRIQFENSFGGPNNTLNAPDQMEKLINAGVPVVLGEHFSGVTLALAPMANQRHRVLLTPCSTNYRLREAGPWVFRILPTDYDQAVRMAQYGRVTLKAERAAVLNIQNAYGRDLAKTFVDHFVNSGGKIAYKREFAEGQREFGGFVAELLNSGSQFIFLVGHTQEMADFLRTKDRVEKRDGRKPLPVLGTDGMYDETFLKQAGSAAEGIVLASAGFNPLSDDPTVRHFVTAFQSRFGKAPNLWSAAAYDAVRVVAEAVRLGGATPEGIRDGLIRMKGVQGATGMNRFDNTGGTSGKPVYTFVIRNGRFVQLD
jgi:branched-chain amino acid transport system substrate-binding protein